MKRETFRARYGAWALITGLTNKLAGFAIRRILPRRFTVRLMGGIMERRYPVTVEGRVAYPSGKRCKK